MNLTPSNFSKLSLIISNRNFSNINKINFGFVSIVINDFNIVVCRLYFKMTRFLHMVKQVSLRFVRNQHRWYMDPEFISQYDGPVMYPTEESKNWFMPNSSGKSPPVKEMEIRNMVVNMGPVHPSAHGSLRLVVCLDGEIVRKVDPHIGFLHRGTEKLMEYRNYIQSLPYFDRLDYLTPICNELPYVLAIEKLLNLDVPRRAKFIRTLLAELTRIGSHLAAIGFIVLESGGLTPFFWVAEEREKLYEIFERVSGARMHAGYVRVGGVQRDLPIGLLDDIENFMSKVNHRLDELLDIIETNRLFLNRVQGISAVDAHEALNRGLTGPVLRATGVKWDIRKVMPYEVYDELDFDVPVGRNGDVYDRFLVRLEELRQSFRIVDQLINKMPEGETAVDDMKISPPKRNEMKSSMEAVIHHFKLFSRGFTVPPGAVYVGTEHPKGEMGVYLVSDGSSIPYRVKIRTASFWHINNIDCLVGRNQLLADLVVTIGSIDIVMGDVDR